MLSYKLQKQQLHELQLLQALLVLQVQLWWCVTPPEVLHDILLHTKIKSVNWLMKLESQMKW